jgi:hypothetical protein
MKPTIAGAALTLAFACTALVCASRVSAASVLPVYPGFVRTSVRMPHGTKVCGHMLTLKEYRATGSASFETVVKWYQQRLAGGTRVDILNDEGDRAAAVFTAGGADAAATNLLSGDTIIALEHFDPPYSRSEIALTIRAEHSDAAARAQIRAQFHCDEGI